MSLLNLRTDLKSLKYGSDRPGGGDSGLPYIKTDINTIDSGFNRLRLTKFDDGLIRGGTIGALNASVTDTLRISKFLIDPPKGPLFIAKQVGLQLSNPRLEVPKNPANIVLGASDNALAVGTNGLLEPTRIYNLGINTIAQIPVNAFGGHFNRHGILPVQTDASKYEAVVTANNNVLGSSEFNRLVSLANKFKLGDRTPNSTTNRQAISIFNTLSQAASIITGISTPPLGISPQDLIIDDYVAGPGSTYGIGRTTINRISNTEDGYKIGLSLDQSKQYAGKTRNQTTSAPELVDFSKDKNTGNNAISAYPIISQIEASIINKAINQSVVNYSNINSKTYAELQKQIEQQQQLKNDSKLSGSIYYNQFGIYNVTGSNPNGSTNGSYSSIGIEKIGYKNSYGDVVIINKSNWKDASREVRVGSGRQDRINLTPLFNADEGKDSLNVKIGKDNYNINDLVKFRIQAINTNNPSKGVYMVFRAYLTDLSDDVQANWNDIKYAGRGDKFYIYDGFSRKMSIGFKVAALSSKEMQPMYQKLNYLMSNLMPDYGEGKVMRGPLVRMTVGNYIDSQLGVLNSLTYKISNDTPWEIALNEPTVQGGIREMVLPHIIEVSLGFTPIGSQTWNQNELPRKANNVTNIAQNYNGKNESSNYIRPDDVIEEGV